MDCLFCSIVEKVIPSNIIYEDDLVFSFTDINPQAPVHFLVIPKKHVKSLEEVKEDDLVLISHIFSLISKLAKQQGVEGGYRVINNCGRNGGQTVDHLHFHVLGNREMLWPPG